MADPQPSPQDRDGRGETDPVLVEDMRDAVEEGDRRWLARRLIALHPADAADALEQLGRDEFRDAVGLLGAELPAALLIELRKEYRVDAVEALPDAALSAAIRALDSDDATTILEDIEEDRRPLVLRDMAPRDRAALERGLTYGEETAGRLMQREVVAAPEYWSVGDAIDEARETGEQLPAQFYEIYVVDPAMHIAGCVSLAMLLRTPRDVPLSEIMVPRLSTIHAEMDQEEVAYQFQKYSLAQAPVTDADDRLIGMITVDDMVHVIQEENTEDLLALSNVSSADGADTILRSVRARAPWLGVNLVTAFLVSGVISAFEGVLSEIVQLAILMPVVAALGGNAGSQGLAVSVRAIAEREMEGAAARRAILRETVTGLVNGIVFALAVALIAWIWFRDPRLSGVISVAMFATFLWAGLSGVLIPLTLRRLGADPAVASSVFLLTMTDVIAFFSFLGLASLVLVA